MKQYIHCVCLLLIFFILGLFTVPTLKKYAGKEVIERYYSDISGFGIAHEDEKNIIAHGGAPTYGEITVQGADALINYLKPQKNDVFVDAGSGVGKLAVHFFFATDVAKSIGIELSQERYEKALKIKAALEKDKLIPQGRSLEFYHEDILKADFKQATIFFMCSTCFSSELMQKITEKLSHLTKGLRVITLKQLPKNDHFELKDTLLLPMTWSARTTVYIYELVFPTQELQK